MTKKMAKKPRLWNQLGFSTVGLPDRKRGIILFSTVTLQETYYLTLCKGIKTPSVSRFQV